MQFTDTLFLFLFLPTLLTVFYICPPKGRNIILILFSLFFYACGSPEFLGLLCISLIIDVALGSMIIRLRGSGKGKIGALLLLIVGILYNVGILGYYKYAAFFLDNVNRILGTGFSAKTVLLPLGLSFYTFKAISYLADAYTGKITDIRPLQAVNYLSFFGQMQSGPIAGYETFCHNVPQKLSAFSDGAVRFMIGFSKKMLLSNVLVHITTEIFENTAALSTSLAWVGAVSFSLQLYYDFSGYSDMAVGICNLLGYECPENFNFPYATKSVAEFWRRWHMTLGAFFRNYVYIPMGGSRAGVFRLYLNLFVVWFLTGIWHGASWKFVLWGMGYFVLIAFEKTFRLPERLPNRALKTLYRVLALLLINFQWVLFRSVNLRSGLTYIKIMCIPTFDKPSDFRALFLLKDYGMFLLLAALLAVPVVPRLEQLCAKKAFTKVLFDILYVAVIAGAFIIALSFVISGQNSPFLYANF